MKAIFSIALITLTFKGLAQTPAGMDVLKLSHKVFTWEVENKIDSLADVFNENFTAFTSSGEKQNKGQYMAVLKGGNVIHNSIAIEDSTAMLVNNTAMVAGKGRFTVTLGGNNRTIHLSYMEVFIRTDEHSPWKMLALHAGLLSN